MADTILNAARAAFRAAPPVGHHAYHRYCQELAAILPQEWATVRKANETDIAEAQQRGLPAVLIDRLRLTDDHLDQLVEIASNVPAELTAATTPTPGTPIEDWGVLRRIPKPLGVALMIYEARPTVTIEGALLFAAAGNAVLLRGGKEIAATNTALSTLIHTALQTAGLPPDLVTILDDPSRSTLRTLLARPDAIDILIPRGSPSLINYCQTTSTIPILASGGGVNHLYIHHTADPTQAATITLNSKIPAPAGCTSLEVALVDTEIAEPYIDALIKQAQQDTSTLTLRLDHTFKKRPTQNGTCRIEPLGKHDLGREFLDTTIAVLTVKNPNEAITHVNKYGTGHTEGIITTNPHTAKNYTQHIDATTIIINGSLRLNDGPTLGLGTEIAISTSRLHARGPITLTNLLTHTHIIQTNNHPHNTN